MFWMPNILHPLACRSGGVFLAVGLLFAAPTARAGEAVPEKSGFTLFHPTPQALLRELNTDRPDTTESAITVDAGHFQLEVSFCDFTRTRSSDGTRVDQTVIAPFNLKVGLTDNTDLQFVFEPHVTVRTRSPGVPAQTRRGLGDMQLRLKINLWGNDGPQAGFGATSFGLMPFVKIPTARGAFGNGRVEGGLILPFGVELPAGFELGLMAELDVVRNASNRRYGAEFVHTATVAHKILGKLGGYVEFVGVTPRRTEGTYQAYFSTGLTFGIGKDVQLDAGVRLALNRGSDDFNAFTGLSVRF